MERKAILFIVTVVIVIAAIYLAFPLLFNWSSFNRQVNQPVDLPSTLPSKFFLKLDTGTSTLSWSATNGDSDYAGSLQFRFGEISRDASGVTGSFSVDATSLKATDPTVQRRLLSAEFLDAGRYITAELAVTGLTFVRPEYRPAGAPAAVYELTGDLTIRGVSQAVRVLLLVAPEEERLVATGSFTISRELFRLGSVDPKLPDLVQISVHLVSQVRPE